MKPAIKGLTSSQVREQREKHGANVLENINEHHWYNVIYNIVTEPLFLILIFAALLYFILGETNEGIIMLLAIIFVSGISIYQENRSNHAVDSLKKIANPKIKVRRDDNDVEINTEDLVVGDIFFLEDGKIVPADADKFDIGQVNGLLQKMF